MSALVEFLTARYDEAEKNERDRFVVRTTPQYCFRCHQLVAGVRMSQLETGVRFDPCGHQMSPEEYRAQCGEDAARPEVLAEIRVKRRIAELHGGLHECTGPDAYAYPYVGCETLRLLGELEDSHDGYDERWRP